MIKLSAVTEDQALTPPVLFWGGLGTVLQIGLVVAGHYSDAVYFAWPVPSLVTAVLAGTAYVAHVRRSSRDSAWHGGMVGGICTFLGTALAAIMADVPALDLATVTLSGIAVAAVAGTLTFAVLGARQPRTSRVAT